MAKATLVTCFCTIQVTSANEYEAQNEVDKMVKREYPLSDNVTLIVDEIIHTTTNCCGAEYKKEKDGNVRRDNSSEVLPQKLVK
ncbi:MAG: hypothetical protein CMN79_03595 [Spirochaetales bacterium]|jgi:hypothetical protein|nr:hypothetical protein [Spirochaetales bacterium]|tara:strand:+ start:527 stop:778 length:252 start_codon:yes stop_codon:yes gene_type:complete